MQRPRTPYFYVPGATVNRAVTNWAAANPGGTYMQTDAVNGRHSDTRVTVCFADGHVKMLRADDVVWNAAAWVDPSWGTPYGTAAGCAQRVPAFQ
jgi:prepilin-type processing-associated H-X9-DG protein